MTSKSFLHIVCLLLLTNQLTTAAKAQEAGAGSSNDLHLDLSSDNRTVTAGNGTPQTITRGGTSVVVEAGHLLTPAEHVALNQVLGGGTQHLVLDAAGRAIGGHFTHDVGSSLAGLVIPTGVSYVHDFGTAGTLSVSGALLNSGNFYAVSSNALLNTALISAGNITNNQGALISSVLPAGGLTGFSNLISTVNISLVSTNNIVNYGNIVSSGNLNLSAGGSIVNGLLPGMTGPAPVMQAVGDISMLAASIQNSGLIASLNSNINVATALAQNLAINNLGGTFEALNGNINVREQLFSGKFHTDLMGGDWLSNELNVFSGTGIINVDVNSISGQLNLVGGEAHVSSASGDLHIGALQMSGDPTIASAGDIYLEMSQFGGNWLFPGPDLLMVSAGKNIINVDVTQIGTSAGSGKTGNIIMTAGGMIDLQTVPVAMISTESNGADSGSITLTAGGPILLGETVISTKSTGGNAGTISITSKNSNIVSSGLLILDSSSTGGNGGDLTLSAQTGISANAGINLNSSSDDNSAGAINITSDTGNIALGNALGANTEINASSIMGTAGQVFIQALSGSFVAGDGLINVSSQQGSGGGFSIYADNGSVSFGHSTIDASGEYGGMVSILTLSGVADINMQDVNIKANGGSSGYGGYVSVAAGLNGASEVTSDNVRVGSIEITGGDSSGSSISVSTSKDDVQVSSITSNGAGINLNSGANIRVDSISNDNPTGLGAFINIEANMNSMPDANSSTLLFNQAGGDNYVGLTTANSAGGGGMLVNNHGLGGIQVGSVSLNAAVGDAGIIALTSDGEIVLSGSYSANGGVNGAGGQILISSATKITAGNVSFSAIGGSDFAGGTVSISAPEIQAGSITVDSSGHGTGSAGSVGIGGDLVTAGTITVTNNGGGATNVQLGGSLHVDNLNIIALGGDDPGKNGGNIAINFHDGVHGALNLNASGASNGSGGSISLSSNTNLDLTGSQIQIVSRGGQDGGNGGILYLDSAGQMSLAAENLDVTPGSGNGNGGAMHISTGLDSQSSSGSLQISGTLNADGAGTGNGGTISISTLNTLTESNFSVENNGAFSLSAQSGSAGGNGGTIRISAGGNLDVDGAGLSVASRGADGDGGIVELTAGAVGSGIVGNGAQTLTVSGALNTDAAGSGFGGEISLAGPQVLIMDGATLSAASLGNGDGGLISISASGSDADLNFGSGTTLSVRSASGNGGSIIASASRDVNLTGSLMDAGSMLGSGGSIDLAAGGSGSGLLVIDADIVADGGGSGNGGSISLFQNSISALQIGAGSGTGLVSASASGSGNGGTLTLNSGVGNNLTVAVTQTVSLTGGSAAGLGTISSSSSGDLVVSGEGTLRGAFDGSAKSVSVTVEGAGSIIGVKQLSSTAGNVVLQASAADGSIVFLDNSNLSVAQGTLELGAPQISFLGNSSVNMDTAGLMKIDSGNATSSLAMNFGGGTVTFNVEQGAAVRPGNILIGPSGQGGTTLAGNGNVDFTGGTVSITSSGGAVSIGAGLSVSSTAFDDTQNLGMEIVATNGDINLDGDISARQLNASAVGSGDINLGDSDINSPTVTLSVQGTSSINQTGNGTIGIGTLVLNSEDGDIGSSLRPLEANVLEMKSASGGSVYVNNASSMDLRSSTVAGTFHINNDGDVSIESNVTAGNLDINANGNISIFNNVDGVNGVTLATGSGSELNIASGVDLSSSAGSMNLSTESLVLDGRLLAQSAGAQVNVSSNAALNLSGSGAQILSGSGGINLSGQDSVTFASSYSLNAGSNGVVTVSDSGSGVTVANDLSVNGGSRLNVSTGALNLGVGSTINLSKTSGTAMLVSSNAGTALNVNVDGSANVASQGGSMEFRAGAGSALNFERQGTGTAALNLTGGNLVTESSAADTSLNNVDLMASGNIEVNVHGGFLNLNGNINSSQQNGLIVLQDPNGMTLTGNGIVGFTGGNSGSIFVQSFGAGNDLTFAGNNVFNAGAGGNVRFSSQSSIIFADNSTSTVNSGASLDISAGSVVFGSQSKVQGTAASDISISSLAGAPVEIITTASSTATVQTNGGSISILGSGADINFSSSGGSNAMLALLGGPVSIATSNSDITINSGVIVNSDHNVEVLSPGGNFVNNGQLQTPGGTTTIEAAGPLFIDQNVSANSLIIQTTANNGSITLGANVNVVNDLTVSAHGSGDIIQTSGLLTASNITLKSGSGNIGSSGHGINVSTTNLSVSTTGSATVNSTGAVRVDSYAVGGTFNLKAGGNIDIGAANASSVSISSNGIFNAGPSGSVNISANDFVSFAQNVKFKVEQSDLNISSESVQLNQGSAVSTTGDLSIDAGSLSLANKAKLTTKGSGDLSINSDLSIGSKAVVESGSDLSITGNVSGGDFNLVAKDNFALNGNLSGQTVGIKTKDDGNIALNGNLNAGSLTIDADGTGSVTQASGLISANDLSIQSDSGNLGSASKALLVDADNLALNTGKSGIVNANSIANVELGNSSSGGNFTITSGGALTVNNIQTKEGSIIVSGAGAVNVAKNAKIVANEGNLTIQSTNLSSGTITLGKNSDLQAYSHSQSTGRGNVRIVIGNVPSTPINGKTPNNVSVSEKYGGNVYFGANGITVNGNNNQLKAWGSNIIFSTGSRPKSAIVLEGGAHILADPPVAEAASSMIPQVLVAPAAVAPVANLSIPVIGVSNSSIVRPVLEQKVSDWIGNVRSQASEIIEESREEAPLTAVAYSSASSATSIGQRSAAFQGSVACFERSATRSCKIITAACDYQSDAAKVAIKKGEMLVNAQRATELESRFANVKLDGGSCAIVKSTDDSLEVYNVYEGHWGAIRVKVGSRHFVLGAGQRLVLGEGSKVASRNEKEHKVESMTVKVAEFALLSLVSNSDVLNKVMKSEAKEDKQLGAKLFKMAACLSVVTSSHGAFKSNDD